MLDAFQAVHDFEIAISDYTGAPYVVTTNSCTMALLLAFAWHKRNGGYQVGIPQRTYPSVPMSAYHAGLKVRYEDIGWVGVYNILCTDIWDCAKRFTSDMYAAGKVQCVSFHAAKLLKIGQGGAILHDDPLADEWYRRSRFDGRAEGIPTKDDEYHFPGWHCYMSPDAAARGLWLLQSYPEHMPDQEPHQYPDMSVWRWQE